VRRERNTAFILTMVFNLRVLAKRIASKSPVSSYFALYRPLQDVQSRAILVCGILLAIAAGAPLPIIGVIFARIIDAFPPTEDEVKVRISQLLAVGTYSSIRT
jgi:ATP-binding cassette subfamily B (MDR/TAP) protein 1